MAVLVCGRARASPARARPLQRTHASGVRVFSAETKRPRLNSSRADVAGVCRPGATGTRYRLRSADLRSRLRLRVRARNTNGGTTVTSLPTREITRAAPTATRAAATAIPAATRQPSSPTTEASAPPPPAPPPEGGDSSPSPPSPTPTLDTLESELQTIVEQVEQAAGTASEAVPSAL